MDSKTNIHNSEIGGTEMGAIGMSRLYEHPVLRLFETITQIPRPSGLEKPITDWILEFARERAWLTSVDTIGNAMIRVPATQGLESAISICMQAHLDMVCIGSNGKPFGAEGFPLRLQIDNDWMSAIDTTLGADNGMGVALALALASESEHGPLELLFTVQEETGMIGAKQLEIPVISPVLVNLDSEDWKKLFIGCAGAFGAILEMPVDFHDEETNVQAWKIDVRGLQGGHSGLEIHKNRGNAIHMLGDMLRALNFCSGLRLFGMEGGGQTNAIPSSAHAVFFSSYLSDEELMGAFESVRGSIRGEFKNTESKVTISLEKVDARPRMISASQTQVVLDILKSLPNGVLAMSAVEGVPQTSINTGILHMTADSGKLYVRLMARSSAAADLEQLKQRLGKLAGECTDLHPLTVSFTSGYPGWDPKPDAPLVRKVVKAWKAYSSDALQVTAIHVGLECGILKAKFPKLEMVSLGPDIRGAHSSLERVSISSVDECYQFLQVLLKRFR